MTQETTINYKGHKLTVVGWVTEAELMSSDRLTPPSESELEIETIHLGKIDVTALLIDLGHGEEILELAKKKLW